MAFIEERLPADADYDSSFSETYSVEINETANGNEYRRLLHPFPKMMYDVGFQMREQSWLVDEIVDFYHRCNGMWSGFRVKNLADFTSNNYTNAPTSLDQPCLYISAGEYQLQKQYGTNGAPGELGYPTRTIFKPVQGSDLVAIQGDANTDYTLDTTTGIISFAANKYREITNITQAAQAVITVGANTFVVGDSVSVSDVTGMTEINGLRANIVIRTNSEITVDIDTTTFTPYTSGGNVQTQPRENESVTAGFEFDIPCRFNGNLDGVTFENFDTLGVGVSVVEILNP